MSVAYRQTWAPPHNPDVEPQKPGYCVYSPSANRFLVGFPRWGTAREAKVYESESAARYQALVLGSVVTSVPRNTGHFLTWEVL